MPLYPNVQAHHGGALTNTFLPRPTGPSEETLKQANQLVGGGTNAAGKREWVLLLPPPMGDKGTQRDELARQRFTENAQGNIAVRFPIWESLGNRLVGEGYAHLDPTTGNVFISEDAAGLRPAGNGAQNTGMAYLARFRFPAALVPVDHPVTAAEKHAQAAASLTGAQAAPLPQATQAPTGNRLSPQQALLQSKLGG